MIELSVAGAVISVSTVAVLAGLWGAIVSVRSAQLGPEWALGHLRRAAPAALAVAGLGILTALWVRPVWIGLAIVYIGLVIAWLARRVARNLQVAGQFGDLAPLPPERQAGLLRRTSRTLLLGGLVISLIAMADLLWRGWPALFDVLLAAALVGPGLLYRRRADQLLAQPSGSSTV